MCWSGGTQWWHEFLLGCSMMENLKPLR
jgi:hypothetical protein